MARTSVYHDVVQDTISTARSSSRPSCPRRRLVPGRLIGAVVAVAALVASSVALARPACLGPVDLQQPDGTVVTARPGGDETFNWVSVDGQLVGKAADGFWCYVLPDAAEFRLSDQRVGLDAAPLDAACLDDVPALRQATVQEPVVAATEAPSGSALVSLQPTEPLLVILVEFTDQTFSTSTDVYPNGDAVAAWQNAIFGTTGKTIRTYFDEASHNTFHFAPAPETYGTVNDGVVRVQLNYPHPNTGSVTDQRNQQITYDALVAADPYVDFGSFDTDDNGGLSCNELHVIVICAGGEASTYPPLPSVWAYHGSLYSPVSAPTLDGVAVCALAYNGGYAQTGEIELSQVGQSGVLHMACIGGPCHELAHDLGLPDLYDRDGSSYGIGMYCLMGYGSWGAASGEYLGATPTLPSAWCRAQLGFVNPTTVATAGAYTLTQASDPADSNILKIPTTNANQYFLVENRQLTGFDEGLYNTFSSAAGGIGGGIAIWHIDESISGNGDETHKKVDLEEANEVSAGGSELDRKINKGNRLQLFYSGNATLFDNTTTPSSKLYPSTTSYASVSNVSASAASMNVTVGMAVTISGYVKVGNVAVPGVTLQGLPGSPTTDSTGFYKATMASGWSGTVTPTKTAYLFSPASLTYTNVASDCVNQDYPVLSRTLYVDDNAAADQGPGDPTVSDPLADGSAEHPYDAIQKAVNAANNEDVIVLLPGTYTGAGNYNVDCGTKALTIRSILPQAPAAVAATVIDCQQAGRAFYFHYNAVTTLALSGVTITNGNAAGYMKAYGGAILCTTSANPTISYCVIQGCTAAETGQGAFGGGIASISAKPVITHCTIRGNHATSTGASGFGGGIYHYGTTPLRVEQCLLAVNSASYYGGAIYAKSSNPALEGCTIVDNTATYLAASGAIYVADTRTFTANRCIFWNNGPQAGITAGSTPTITYSDVQGGFTGTGNIASDPAFVDADGPDDLWYTWQDNDYHLTPDSPCVNAGNTAYVPPAGEVDIDGQLRLIYDAVDIGADEFTWPGDVNDDGSVDVVDVLMFVDAFGSVLGDSNYDPHCDFNSDGSVDVGDLLIQVDNFGQPNDSSQMSSASRTFGLNSRSTMQDAGSAIPMSVYEALESVGLLDVYLDYIAEHPEAVP